MIANVDFSSTAIVSVPTLTMSSSSSGSEPRSRSSTLSTQSFSLINDSDDEIVWDISSDYRSSEDNESTEDSIDSDPEDDFVLLSRLHSPRLHSRSGLSTPNPGRLSPTVSALTSELTRLSLPHLAQSSDSRQSDRLSSPAKGTSPGDVAPPLTPYVGPAIADTPKKRRRGRQAKERRKAKRKAAREQQTNERAPKTLGLGFRPVVDDVSESGVSTDIENEDSSMYEEAVRYITSFLRNPSAYDERSSRLTLLQSLIIELGLSSSSVPASLTSARALLKSQVFLNIRQYLAVRDQGPEALRQALYPSRSALIKSIRKQPRTRASLEWVKDHGLSVLLVTAFHH